MSPKSDLLMARLALYTVSHDLVIEGHQKPHYGIGNPDFV